MDRRKKVKPPKEAASRKIEKTATEMATERAQEEEAVETKVRRGRRRKPRFYAESLDVAEQSQMDEALAMEGLDEEIALLRVRLRRTLEEQPDNTEFLLRSIALLARLMATRYKLSEKAEDDLYQNILGVIRGIGGAILPEAFGDEK